jgi:two pore calcium channel protein 2
MCNRIKPMILERINQVPIQPGCSCSQFMKLFDLMDFYPLPKKPMMVSHAQPVIRTLQFIFQHHWFTMFGNMVTGSNVICITLELLQPMNKVLSVKSPMYVWNMIFIIYYVAELTLKIWAKGWAAYMWSKTNVYEGFITILIIIVEAFCILEFGFPFTRGGIMVPIWSNGISFHVYKRVANILIILRLLRVLADIKAMNIVASTIYNLFLNLTPFAGILVVMYYTFAIVGMELFHGVIHYDNFTNWSFPNVTPAHKCGSYQQLGYYPANFNDFASTIVVLWDLMVVNNWNVFLYAYEEASGKWSKLFFMLWFVVAVVIGLNLFTVGVIEIFIMKWDKAQKDAHLKEQLIKCANSAGLECDLDHPHLTVSEFKESLNHTVHNLFKSNLLDPEEAKIMQAVRSHVHLNSLLEDDEVVSLGDPIPVSVPIPVFLVKSAEA